MFLFSSHARDSKHHFVALSLADALAKLKDMVATTPQIQMMVDIIRQAKRVIVR